TLRHKIVAPLNNISSIPKPIPRPITISGGIKETATPTPTTILSIRLEKTPKVAKIPPTKATIKVAVGWGWKEMNNLSSKGVAIERKNKAPKMETKITIMEEMPKVFDEFKTCLLFHLITP